MVFDVKERLHKGTANVDDVFEMEVLRGERAWMLGGKFAYLIWGMLVVPSCRADAAGEVNMVAWEICEDE